jgi:hypothetical protein
MKAGIVFASVLAVVLLILSAANMGEIGSVEKKADAARAEVKALAEENAKLKDRVAELEKDFNSARNKVAILESRSSANVGEVATRAANEAVETYLEEHKEEIAEEAARKVDLSSVTRDVSELRSAIRRGARAPAGTAAGGEDAAGAPAAPAQGNAEPLVRAIAEQAGQELGMTDQQQEKVAETITKGMGDFMTLIQQRRDGQITDEEFRQKMTELREQGRKAFEENLTEEQREQMRQRRDEWRRRREEGGERPLREDGGGAGGEAF